MKVMKNLKDYKINSSMNPFSKKWLAALSLSTLMLGACDTDELLQKTPPTRVSSAEVFSSPTRIEGLVQIFMQEDFCFFGMLGQKNLLILHQTLIRDLKVGIIFTRQGQMM